MAGILETRKGKLNGEDEGQFGYDNQTEISLNLTGGHVRWIQSDNWQKQRTEIMPKMKAESNNQACARPIAELARKLNTLIRSYK